MKLTTIFLALLGLFAVSQAVMLECPETVNVHAVLSEFYLSTGGPLHWVHKWDISNPNYCTYYGINCVAGDIILTNNNLVGEIPESFWCLENFKIINLADNHNLRGNITYMESLSNVQYFNLSSTAVSGELPSFIRSELKVSIKLIDLGHTCITGEIPHSIFLLHYLAALRLDHTDIDGYFPLGLFITPLRELWIQCTGIEYADLAIYYFRLLKNIPEAGAPYVIQDECPNGPLPPVWCLVA